MEDNLDSLPSNIGYYLLDKKYVGTEFGQYCDLLKSEFATNHEIHSLCSKFLRNFDKIISQFVRDRDDAKEDCKSLNYWLYDSGMKISSDNIVNDITSSNIITKLHDVWNAFNTNKYCDIQYYKIEKTDFYSMKTLYDYARDYVTIKSKIMNSDNKCSEVYHDYIEKGKEAYRDINIMCMGENIQEGVPSQICPEFKYIKKINGDEDLSKLTCKKTEIIPIQEEEEGDPQLVQQGLGESVSDGTSSSTAMGIIFPFLGITLILFMLYKFTPFGPFLRSYLIKKKLIRYNIDENETFQELPHVQDYANKNNENDMRNIGYNAG
ncbi:PIR Superfamily Protein [Plasmodium ovale curtisi]|uniref:PIR Superfamily Protein n=1 Tax=Plasmodium ovale curtisi TaxID=864141 RepID=A0A1A8XEX3_PLAOA|nr:PIR Superfamily Protein [Plasmodium ovale curtisi]